MKLSFLFWMLPLFLLTACGASGDDKKLQSADEVMNAGKLDKTKIYHNPVTADKPVSEEEAAKMEFEETSFDFGTLNEGQKVEHVFKFKNSGKNPLVITNAKGSCGCTVPSWPSEPIAPGASGEIKVAFNSEGKGGQNEKDVYITANTIPNKTTLHIMAYVKEKP